MIYPATDIGPLGLSLVLVALSASLIALGWVLGRKSLIDGFRMGRMSIDKPDIGPLGGAKKPEKTQLGEEHDPWNEAMKDQPGERVQTLEG